MRSRGPTQYVGQFGLRTIQAKLVGLGEYTEIAVNTNEGISHFISRVKCLRYPTNFHRLVRFYNSMHRGHGRAQPVRLQYKTKSLHRGQRRIINVVATREVCRFDDHRSDTEHRSEESHIDRQIIYA